MTENSKAVGETYPDALPGLAGKRALVTGAGGAIGGAVVSHLLAAGAKVVATDISDESLAGLIAQYGDRITTIVADVSSPDDMAAATNKVVSVYGGIDVAVLGAGIEGVVGPVDESDVAMFDRVMAVNVKGVWLGFKYTLAAMRATSAGGGSIIALSSVAGMRGAAKSSVYSASKHAVIGMVRSVAAEAGPDGIRVNAVCPASVEGRMMQSLERGYSADKPDRVRMNMEKKIPMGRYAKPGEIASMVAYLASDQASFCNGGTYVVDGGKTAI